MALHRLQLMQQGLLVQRFHKKVDVSDDEEGESSSEGDDSELESELEDSEEDDSEQVDQGQVEILTLR